MAKTKINTVDSLIVSHARKKAAKEKAEEKAGEKAKEK